MTSEMLESVLLLEKKLGLTPCVTLEHQNTLVFIYEHKIVGFLVWIETENLADILNVGVDKAYQKQGIGSSLLVYWLNLMRNRGVRSLFCEVRDSNLIAFHLYLKCGFKINRRRKDYYSDPTEDGLEMRFDYE